MNHHLQFFHVQRTDKDTPSLLTKHRPHGPVFSASGAVGGGRGPGLCALLPLSSLFFPAADGDAVCPDRGGSLWLHLHLHLPGGADHLRQGSENGDSATHYIRPLCVHQSPNERKTPKDF